MSILRFSAGHVLSPLDFQFCTVAKIIPASVGSQQNFPQVVHPRGVTRGAAYRGVGRDGPFWEAAIVPRGWRKRQRTWCFQWELVGAAAAGGLPAGPMVTKGHSQRQLCGSGQWEETSTPRPLSLIASSRLPLARPNRAPDRGAVHQVGTVNESGEQAAPEMKSD